MHMVYANILCNTPFIIQLRCIYVMLCPNQLMSCKDLRWRRLAPTYADYAITSNVGIDFNIWSIFSSVFAWMTIARPRPTLAMHSIVGQDHVLMSSHAQQPYWHDHIYAQSFLKAPPITNLSAVCSREFSWDHECAGWAPPGTCDMGPAGPQTGVYIFIHLK